MRILAAMSGGVDSAVAAARAVEAGHDVVGVHLALSRAGGTLRTGSRGCCTIEDAMDARRAADLLGIPFYVWDFSERFRDDVIDDFIAEYRAGRTPEPVHALQREDQVRRPARARDRARLRRRLHRATTRRSSTAPDGLELHRASDAAKDQSYVLGVLTAEQLAHTYFPLGATPSKAVVRAEAAERGLTVAQKPDSHDICFIPDGDTRGWLAEKVGAATGRHRRPRRAPSSARHEGAHAFTVGQRRGLTLGVPGRRRQAAVRARGAPGVEHRRRRAEGGARDRRDRRRAVLLGGRRAGRRRRSRATCRSARTPTPCRRAPTLVATDRDHASCPRRRSTASRPARPPCSTSARACSASSRSTARCRRCPALV